MQSGKLITFEGLDGCGKSTQLEKTKKWLNLQGYEVLKTQQPGGTKIGKQIRNILLNPEHNELHPESELLLYLSDRIQHLTEKIIPAKAEATFNIRFNNKHSSNSTKKRLNKIFVRINKKYKSKFKIDYRVSGEAFLTKPNKTTYMIQNIIKKITKIKPKLSTTGGTSDLRFIKAISPGLEFGLVGKTMHKVDEAVSLKDLKNLKKIYQNILQNYFK